MRSWSAADTVRIHSPYAPLSPTLYDRGPEHSTAVDSGPKLAKLVGAV